MSTFLELQNDVLTDRFDESERAEAKRRINSRYGRVWAQEPWIFKLRPFTFPVTAGASTLTLTGVQRVLSVWDNVAPSFWGMYADRPEDFYRFASSNSSIPGAYTVMNGVLYFDRPVSSDRTIQIVGEAAFTPMVEDTDEPEIPEEFHAMLEHGAVSEMLRKENDPSWVAAEQDYQAMLNEMKSSHLTSVRTYGDAAPSWP